MRSNEFINEGIFDVFRKTKKKPTEEYLPLTDEQRVLIKKHFPNSNVSMRMRGPDSEYVLPHNAHAMHGRMRIAFRNEGGVLYASISHHASESDASNPKVVPVGNSDRIANSDSAMEEIKRL